MRKVNQKYLAGDEFQEKTKKTRMNGRSRCWPAKVKSEFKTKQQ